MLQALKEKTVEWLRWSERYTKTDMVYLAKGGGWLTGSKVFSILGGLALATAFANLVPQETYGTYKFLVSAAGIIGAFTLSGMGTAVTQAAARGFNSALRHGFRAKLKWSIGIVVVGLLAAGYYFWQGNITLTYGMLMIAALYPLRTSSGIFENYLEGKKDFERASKYSIGLETFQITSMVATLFLTDSVLWVFFVFLATNTFAAIYLYFRTKSVYPQTDSTKEDMITYSKHLSIVEIFRKIARHIDKVLVWHFLGPVQLAVYSFAELPISKLQTAAGSLRQIAMPKFAENDMETLRKTLDYKVFLLAMGLLGISVVYIFAAPYLFNLLFPEYLASIPYTQVYALSIVLFAGGVYEKTLEAHEKTKWIYINRIGSNVVKVISLLILLPLFGVWGAITSLLAWRFFRATFSFIGYKTSS